jgi:hypothetical protein
MKENKEKMALLYEKGLSYRDIGFKFNISRQRVHQILTDYNWSKKHPKECKVHRLLIQAVRIGVVKKAPCAICGKSQPVVAHHEDYNKPLEVIWLCQEHHGKLHGGTVELPNTL